MTYLQNANPSLLVFYMVSVLQTDHMARARAYAGKDIH